MLKPSKHTELDQTVLAVSATVLRKMRDQKFVNYVALRNLVREQSLVNDVLFAPALSFLFVLGLIEYHPKGDLLEYTGPR